MTTDTEALVRRAYHLAEGDVLDVRGFIKRQRPSSTSRTCRTSRSAASRRCRAYYPILDEAAAALDRARQLLSAHLASAERVTA
jgi:hypothetical protein